MEETLTWKAEVIDAASAALSTIQASTKRATAAFDEMKASIKAQAKDFTDALAPAAKATAAALAATGAAAVALAAHVAGVADQASKTAAELGLTTQAVQELEHAARASNVPVEAMNAALVKISANAVNNASVFGLLGVSVRDAAGHIKSSEQLLAEFADGLKQVDDPALRSKLAVEALGEGAGKLKPLLDQGSEGLSKLRQQARDLGVVMSDAAIQDSQAFRQSLGQLNAQFTAVKQAIGAELIPVFTAMSEHVQALAGDLNATEQASAATRDAIQSVTEAVKSLSPVVTVATTVVGVAIDALKLLRITAEMLALGFAGAVEGVYMLMNAVERTPSSLARLEAHTQRVAVFTQELRDQMADLGNATLKGIETGEQWAKTLDGIADAAQNANRATDSAFAGFVGPTLDKRFEDTRKKAADYRAELKKATDEANNFAASMAKAMADRASAMAETIVDEARREAIAAVRLDYVLELDELQRIELERARELLELEHAIADGELTRTEQVFRRAEIERNAADARKKFETDIAAAAKKQADEQAKAQKARALLDKQHQAQQMADAQTYGGALASVFEAAGAGLAVMSLIRGAFHSAEALAYAATFQWPQAAGSTASAFAHFTAASKHGAGGGGASGVGAGGAAAAAAGPGAVVDMDQQRRSLAAAFADAWREINAPAQRETVILDFSGATFVGRDQASARDLADLIGQSTRLKLGRS